MSVELRPGDKPSNQLFYNGENIAVKRILLTGMSGTGKSTVIDELAARGYKAVDLDQPGWSEYAPDGDWVWSEARVQELLIGEADEDSEILFVSGCAINQGKFYPYFDEVILLSTSAALIVKRLTTRTNNQYGKHPDELAATLGYLETVEPLLRRGAGHEIDTSAALDQVVASVLQIAQSQK
jgi:shikimate kinase